LSTISFTRGANLPRALRGERPCERSPLGIAAHIMGKIAHNLCNNYDASPLTDERVDIEEEI
jgi:hypothetical protein